MGKILNSDIRVMSINVQSLNSDMSNFMVELDVNSNSLIYEYEKYNRGVRNYNRGEVHLTEQDFIHVYTVIYAFNRINMLTRTYAVNELKNDIFSTIETALVTTTIDGTVVGDLRQSGIPTVLGSLFRQMRTVIAMQIDNIYNGNVLDLHLDQFDADIILSRTHHTVSTQPLCSLNVNSRKLGLLTTTNLAALRNNQSRLISIEDLVNKLIQEI